MKSENNGGHGIWIGSNVKDVHIDAIHAAGNRKSGIHISSYATPEDEARALAEVGQKPRWHETWWGITLLTVSGGLLVAGASAYLGWI